MERLVNLFSSCGFNGTFGFRCITSGTSKQHVFSAYVKEHFHGVKTDNPALKPTEVLKKLSEMYKVTPAEELSKLQVVAAVNKKSTPEERAEMKKKLMFARRHGLPKAEPTVGYRVFLHEQLVGMKGTTLTAMTSKLAEASRSWKNLSTEKKEPYNMRASENKLAHMRSLRDWSEENEIQFSKKSSVLVNRLYCKHQRTKSSAVSKKSTP